MKCKERDQDLLMSGLGEASFWQRFRIDAHLLVCLQCRTRMAELLQVSNRLAEALRPPTSGGAGGARSFRPRGLSPLYVVALATLVFTLFIAVGSYWYAATYFPQRATHQDDGCRPGLPTDRCK